jgi:hypothetical protein
MSALIMILFWIAVGIVIGWNVPRPDWAKQAQDEAMKFFGQVTGKTPDNTADNRLDKTDHKDSGNQP